MRAESLPSGVETSSGVETCGALEFLCSVNAASCISLSCTRARLGGRGALLGANKRRKRKRQRMIVRRRAPTKADKTIIIMDRLERPWLDALRGKWRRERWVGCGVVVGRSEELLIV